MKELLLPSACRADGPLHAPPPPPSPRTADHAAAVDDDQRTGGLATIRSQTATALCQWRVLERIRKSDSSCLLASRANDGAGQVLLVYVESCGIAKGMRVPARHSKPWAVLDSTWTIGSEIGEPHVGFLDTRLPPFVRGR